MKISEPSQENESRGRSAQVDHILDRCNLNKTRVCKVVAVEGVARLLRMVV